MWSFVTEYKINRDMKKLIHSRLRISNFVQYTKYYEIFRIFHERINRKLRSRSYSLQKKIIPRMQLLNNQNMCFKTIRNLKY